MKIVRQTYPQSCGACAYAAIVGISEVEAIGEVGTKKSGTLVSDVACAFRKRGLKIVELDIYGDFETYIHDLRRLSHFKVFVSADFVSNNGRGRNTRSPHAIALYDGRIYDSNETLPIDIDCFRHAYNRKLIIKKLIIVIDK